MSQFPQFNPSASSSWRPPTFNHSTSNWSTSSLPSGLGMNFLQPQQYFAPNLTSNIAFLGSSMPPIGATNLGNRSIQISSSTPFPRPPSGLQASSSFNNFLNPSNQASISLNHTPPAPSSSFVSLNSSSLNSLTLPPPIPPTSYPSYALLSNQSFASGSTHTHLPSLMPIPSSPLFKDWDRPFLTPALGSSVTSRAAQIGHSSLVNLSTPNAVQINTLSPYKFESPKVNQSTPEAPLGWDSERFFNDPFGIAITRGFDNLIGSTFSPYDNRPVYSVTEKLFSQSMRQLQTTHQIHGISIQTFADYSKETALPLSPYNAQAFHLLNFSTTSEALPKEALVVNLSQFNQSHSSDSSNFMNRYLVVEMTRLPSLPQRPQLMPAMSERIRPQHFMQNFPQATFSLKSEPTISQILPVGYLNQALNLSVHPIIFDPTSPLPYLERSLANFQLGNYEKSVADYKNFASQIEKKYPLSIPEFTVGFAKGLPKGIYDSGTGLFLAISDLVLHPVQTARQTWDALTQLNELARTKEWELLSKALAPELHHLVINWDKLPSDQKGEQAGYVFGKYGADLLIPGAAAKGLKEVRKLNTICKGLKITEQTLLLETVAASKSGAKIGEAIKSTQKTLTLGKELGFTTQDLSKLKQAGKLEGTVKRFLDDPHLQGCYARFEKAQDFLEPYSKKCLPEAKARELIQQAGMTTFLKPRGVPDNFLIRITEKGAGIEYIHPIKGAHISIRVMPGKPHSPFPYQQKPYVIQGVSGKAFDKHGKLISLRDPEAHIPIEEFIYRGN